MPNLSTSNNVWNVDIAPGKDSSNRTLQTGGTFLDRDIKISVSGDSNLTAGNIKSGIKIFGVTGTYNNEAHSSYTPSSTYFQTGTSGAVSTTAVIPANQYTGTAQYLIAGTAGAISGGGLTHGNITTSDTTYLTDTNTGYEVNFSNIASRAAASYNITKAGWISSAGTGLSATGDDTKTLKKYIVKGTLSSKGGSVTGSNVTLGTTDNGISVTGSGQGTVTAAGWIAVGDATASSQTKYITAMTIPANKNFNGVTMTAGTVVDSTQKYTQFQLNASDYNRITIAGTAKTDTKISIIGSKNHVVIGEAAANHYIQYFDISSNKGSSSYVSNLRVGSTTNSSREFRGYITNLTLRGYNTNTSYPDYIGTLNVGTNATYKNASITTLNNYGTIGTLAQTGTISTLSGDQTITNLSGTLRVGNNAVNGTLTVNAYNDAATPALTGVKTIVSGGKWSKTTLTSTSASTDAYGWINYTKNTVWSPVNTYYTTTNSGYGAIPIDNLTPSSAYYIKAGSVTTPTTSGASTSTSLDGDVLTVSRSVTPTVSAGWIASGTAGTVTITGIVPTQTKTVTPTTSSQTVSPDSGKLLSSVTVDAAPAPVNLAVNDDTIASNIWDISAEVSNVDIGVGATLATGKLYFVYED